MPSNHVYVRVMSFADPVSLAIAQDILHDNRIPFNLSGATTEGAFYGPGNVALSASIQVEERDVDLVLELLQGLNGVLRAPDHG